MDERSVFPDWPAKRDAIRAALAARTPLLYHAGPLRPVRGAVTDPDGDRAQVAVRAAFLDVAGAVEPRLLVDLAGDPLDQYAAAWDATGGSSAADPEVEADAIRIQWCHQKMLAPHGAMWRWSERWDLPFERDVPERFPDLEDFDVYSAPSRFSAFRTWAPQGWGLENVALALSYWRVRPLRESNPLPFDRILSCYEENLELDAPLRLPEASWDPQGEDRATATKRILADMGRAVRSELGRMESEAARTAVRPPVKRTGLDHLAWLARHHFRHESFSAIARDVYLERQTVTEAVKAVAELVGLPLREPTRGGQRWGDRRKAESVRLIPERS